MSRKDFGHWTRGGIAVVLITAAATGCGSSGASTPTSATPGSPSTAATSAGAPVSASTSSSAGAGSGPQGTAGSTTASASSTSTGASGASAVKVLPRADSDYGQGLINAWVKGDRKAASVYATPAAVTALFRQRPVKDLVNYSCEDDLTPTVCGWIGAGDVRVELSVDSAKVRKGQAQAVTRARLAMP